MDALFKNALFDMREELSPELAGALAYCSSTGRL
jgi:hypothetical protein